MARHVVSKRRAGLRGKMSPAVFAHPTAVVDRGAQVGVGTRIWHFSHVMTGARIGRSCTLGQNVFVGAQATIGDRVKIQNNVSVYDGVVIEDDVFCGPSMVFTNVINPRSHIPRKHELRRTVVGRGASIGANATVICGHSIGRYAFIGAGSVVTRDVPDYALVVGVPARIAGWMCQCGSPLRFRSARARCPSCAAAYARSGNRVRCLGGGLRPPSEPPPKSLRWRSQRSKRNTISGEKRIADRTSR